MTRGIFDTWPMFATPRCVFCALPINSQKRATLHLNAYGARNPKAWAVLPFGTEDAALSHDACEHPAWGHGDMGYHVSLRRLADEGFEEWDHHLRQKTWWNPVIGIALQQAHALAVRLRRPLATGTANGGRVKVSPRVRAIVLERDGFRCRRCGASPDDGARLVIDHITPLAAGGQNTRRNLQTLCDRCNAGKAARAPHSHDLRERIP